ncbi:MAG: Arc family DNA binding domain-containing protein [Bacteroidales bacterium]|nr:Arc family DNA binding domain-containing protein [Bacteroidales bacterium]
MAEKKVFALRVNEDLLKAVEKWASDEFRSVNGQLEWIISKALSNAGRSPNANQDGKKPESKK